jgi:hypothetical protein
MMIPIASLAFVLAAICAALMGFAIQRGATCMVAAVNEIAHEKKSNRLRAMAETSLWVAGGLLTARAIGLLPQVPGGFALSGWTILGGMLLGIGAHINRACVFGSIAHIGSGNIAYWTSPLGFYVGAATTAPLFAAMRPEPMASLPPGSALPLWLAPLFLAFAAWRIISIFRDPAREGFHWRTVWRPHEATIFIGINFVILFVVAGAWAYTDLFAQLAAGKAPAALLQSLLLLALLVGATLGSWTSGSLRWRWPSWSLMLRCFVGGMVMGWGSLLIPGSNDGLILVGLPLLWPYAWVAVAVMCVTIWVAILAEQRLSPR